MSTEPIDDINDYALNLIANGGESTAEDDMDEDGVFEDEYDHEKACDLACAIADVIREDKPIRDQLVAAGRRLVAERAAKRVAELGIGATGEETTR